jgi:hypothetical protein
MKRKDKEAVYTPRYIPAVDTTPEQEIDYVPIAASLERLCKTYGRDKVLGILCYDMPSYFYPDDRKPRHRRALRKARTLNL